MSYKTREKKRQSRIKNRAIKKIQRGHPDRWYLTLVKKKTCCNNPSCGGILDRGAVCFYRHQPMEILCQACGAARGIAPRPSALYEKKVTKPRAQRNAARSRNQREKGRSGMTPPDVWNC